MNTVNSEKFNSKRYRKSYLEQYNNIFTKIRLNKMVNMISNCTALLDIGCWDCSIMKLIIDTGKVEKIIGVDNSYPATQKCKKNGFKAYHIKSADYSLPFAQRTFDAIFAGEIIEHLYDTTNFVKEIYRVLKPHGQLIISTPNLSSLGSRLTLMIGKTPWMIENTLEKTASGHIRYFTFFTLENLLIKNGFKIVEKNSDILHLGNNIFTSSNLLTKPFHKLGRIIIIKAVKK